MPSVSNNMADTRFRWRRCSMTCTAVSRPEAIEVPPPAERRSVSAMASSRPSVSMRRRRNALFAKELKVTRPRRSVGRAWSMTKRTASCTWRSLSPRMEPLTSRTQIRSMACLSCAQLVMGAWIVTKPKTSCVEPRGNAEYSTRVLKESVPPSTGMGSGSGRLSCAAAVAKASLSGSSSSKRCACAPGKELEGDIKLGSPALVSNLTDLC
mmetsp:Transcript_72952/g.156222  ORF Transcript_72952/g.156222 Transcript_72952/m.156222 type:complete len:210 (+) Transcript_72952:1049-1678(+)